MADNNYIVTVTFKADPGDVGSQAASAGKQAGDQFARAAEDAIKKVNISGALESQLSGRSPSDKSFVNKLSQNITDAISSGVKNVPAAAIQPSAPPPMMPREAASDVERATLGINSFLSGVKAFATYMDKDASMLTVLQLAGQAMDFGQRYGRAAAEARAAAATMRAEAAAARSSTGVVAEMSGAGGFGAAAEMAGGSALEASALGGAGALVAGTGRFGALAARLAPAAGVLSAGYAAITVAQKSRDAIIDTAGEAVEAAQKNKLLAETMGLTRRELVELQYQFERAGVPANELDHTFFRLAVRARRSMPEITHEVEDSADRQIEANLKVEASGRALADAHDQRALSVDRAKKAEGELIKVQQTEATMMEQQREAAALAVSGAQLGERGAQMRRTRADIAERYAPQEARLAEIAGPLTVEGARLGRQGAQIAYEEARARYYGQEPDADLQERKRLQALQTARHNLEQSDLNERRATIAERKRREEVAAGVGPEQQARLQAQEAAQAEKLANLHTRQTELAELQLTILQKAFPAEARIAEARANRDKAIRGVAAAADEEEKARIEDTNATKAAARLRYKDIETVQKAIRGEAEPGFEISQVDSGTLPKALFREGGFEVKGVLDALRRLNESPMMRALPEDRRTQELERAVQATVGGRGLGDAVQGIVEFLKKPRPEITPDIKALLDKVAPARTPEEQEQRDKQIEEFKAEMAKQTLEMKAARQDTRGAALQTAAGLVPGQTADMKFMQDAATAAIKAFNFFETGLRNIDSSLNALPGAVGEVVQRLQQKAQEIGSIEFPNPQTGGGGGGGKKEITFTEADYGQQAGGLLHGLGTGTSDQIPIMASPGEFVVRASEASRPGMLGLLNRINAGKFQEGGAVPDPQSMTGLDMALRASEQEWASAARTGPMKTLLDTELHRSEAQWAQAVKTGPLVTGLDTALHAAEANWRRAVSTGDLRTGLDDALHQAEDNWRRAVRTRFQGGGAIASGSAPSATVTRNPYTADSDYIPPSYQERALIEHDGFDPDNPQDVALWRARVGRKLPPNMGMPGGPTGAGVIAHAQVWRGPAGPITVLKPGIGQNYTISTPGGGADVKYNSSAGRYWPEGQDKPYNPNDPTTFGKPGVKFDPMFSATWSKGYVKDIESNPLYLPVKTSDKDLATPIKTWSPRDDNVPSAPSIPNVPDAGDAAGAPIDWSNRSQEDAPIDRPPSDEDEKAVGGLIRRYFAGGLVGYQEGGPLPPPPPDMGGAITRAALEDLASRLQRGINPAEYGSSIATMPGSTYGGPFTASASALAGLNSLGVYQLDLRTNAGNFPAAVSEETMEAVRRSSLMGKISSTGQRPTWYS